MLDNRLKIIKYLVKQQHVNIFYSNFEIDSVINLLSEEEEDFIIN